MITLTLISEAIHDGSGASISGESEAATAADTALRAGLLLVEG